MKLSPPRLSIRVILVSILLLVLLPVLGAVGLVLISSAHLQQQAIEASLQSRAKSLAAEVDAKVEDLAAELRAAAAAGSTSPEQAENALAVAAHRLIAGADWRGITLIDENYHPLMLAGTVPAETLERLSWQLRKADAAQRFTVFTTAAPDGRAITGIAVPLRQGAAATATILGIPHRAVLLPTLNSFDRSEGAVTGLIDPDGKLIATSSAAKARESWPEAPIRLAAQGASGAITKVSIGGSLSYVATVRLHDAQASIAYAVPASVIEAPLRLSNRLFGALVLLVTVPVALVFLLGHFLAGQIRALTVVADAVAQEQSPPAIQPSPLQEVAAVQRALLRAAEMTQERTQARERLRIAELDLARLQRLDTVGQLAAGVAHDFGNYLVTIRGNLEAIRTAISDNPQVQQRVVTTLALAQQALRLVQQLSTLARRRPSGARQINAGEVLQEIADLLRHVAGPAVRLEFSLASRLWDCRFDPLRLQSGLVNLVTNARDAMPDGGTIRIGARNLTLDAERAATLGVPSPGRYVALSVSDTGIGMSPETAAHVFEPFFTTKAADHGNGIGLSLLHGWVKTVGGHISVDTQPNAGTTFSILLPEHKAVLATEVAHEGRDAPRATVNNDGSANLVR